MIFTHKSSETTCATPGDYLVSWNRKPMGQRDLLASMTMVQDNLCQLQFPQSYIYHMEHGSLPITMTSCEMSVSHKVVFIFKKKEKTLTYFVPLCYETGKKKTKLPYFCFFFPSHLRRKTFHWIISKSLSSNFFINEKFKEMVSNIVNPFSRLIMIWQEDTMTKRQSLDNLQPVVLLFLLAYIGLRA